MAVTYKLTIDKDYYRKLIARYYQQRPFFFQLPVQFGAIALALAASLTFGFGTPSLEVVSFAASVGTLVYFGGIALTKWGIFQRFRFRADFGTEVTVTMSDTGLPATGRHVEGTWTWEAYPKSVRFQDGLMLLRPGVIRWLPDAALIAGTVEEATAAARAKSALREVA
jgi:hypothetical protein